MITREAMSKFIIKLARSRCLLFLVTLVVLRWASTFMFDISRIDRGISRQNLVTNGSFSIESVPIEKQVKYVIFDASGYNEGLGFLNRRKDGWRVLVVNLANESRIISCDFCSSMTNDTVTLVLEKWKFHIDKVEIDSKGLTLLAAILSVLSQEPPWIYVTNRPVSIPYNVFERVTKKEIKTGLVYQGSVLEPCSHFIDPFKWNGLGIHPIGNRFSLREISPHSVYYVLNECFRKDMGQQDWEKSLDTKAPIPYTIPGTFAAVNFKNVLVSNPNAWILIASVFPDDKENTETWSRSQIINLMVQRVLWETHSNLGVMPDVRNVEKGCPTCDLHSRLDQSGEEIMAHLVRWRCDNSETVLKCLLKLATQDDINPNIQIKHLVYSWVTVFEKIARKPIERIVLNDIRLGEKTKGEAVYFTPAKSLHKSEKDDTRPPNAYKQICNIDDKPYVAKVPAQYKEEYEDILLIVIYNYADIVRNIPLMEYTHGRHFKHIIHCSSDLDIFTAEFHEQFNVNPVSFIEVGIGWGSRGQNCMAVVVKMGYNVKGYLQVGDDVLVNTWNFPSLPFEKPWFQAKLRVLDLDADRVPCVWRNKDWIIWTNNVPSRTRNAFKRVQQAVFDATNGPMASKFLKNIANITRCDHCFVYETSDIVYLPRRLVSEFSYFIDLFTLVHLEIAFPTVLVGISSDAEIFRLRGNYLWYNERVMYPYVWTEFNHFHHPFKLITDDKNDIEFYCQKYLARLDKDIDT